MKRIIYQQLIQVLTTILFISSASVAVASEFNVDKLDKLIQHEVANCTFSGVVLVAHNNELVFHRAYGLANRNYSLPNTLQNKFRLGSLSKLFTATQIALLAQQGKINLDEPASRYVPKWLTSPLARKIKVSELLYHASGLGNYQANQHWKNEINNVHYLEVKDYLPLIASEKLLFSPGSKQHYSNSAYVVLGAIVEAVQNKPFRKVLQEHLFDPNKMNNTGRYRLDYIIKNLSVGYTFQPKHNPKWQNNYYAAPFVGSPAGDYFSTSGDLLQFARFLLSSDILSQETRQALLSSQAITTDDKVTVKDFAVRGMHFKAHANKDGFVGLWNQYGFALWDDGALIGHTGGINGAATFFALSPKNKDVIIILQNQDGHGIFKIANYARKALGYQGDLIDF